MLVAPPVACLAGSLLPWATPLWSGRLSVAWRGPWSLIMLGWPGTLVTVLLALAVICSVLWVFWPQRLPQAVKDGWRGLGIACLGVGLGALALVASSFAAHVASDSGLFGLGAWFGIAAGGRLFIVGAVGWTLRAHSFEK